MKYSEKTNINQTAPLLRLIPSLVAGVVIASLSTSVAANPLNAKLQTPAKVEQALTALLDASDVKLQLANHMSTQASSSVSQLVAMQAATKKVDHSQKSIAELVLVSLAITSQAKDELSESTPAIEPAVALAAQDYAAEEVLPAIVSEEKPERVEADAINDSDDPENRGIEATDIAASDLLEDHVDANVTVKKRSAGCPENFNTVSIPVNGKLCQIFAADFPASMILFIPQTPEEVIQYYLASSNNFVEPKTIKKRTMLKSADNNTTLIISEDGAGTQVDILVMSPEK